jgi:hypothetical protein
MATSIRWKAAGLAALAVGFGLLAVSGNGAAADSKGGDLYKPVVPDEMLTILITEESKSLKDALAKASDKKMAAKAKAAAFMIAVYSQEEVNRGGSKAAAMAGLREIALKVAKNVGDGKLDDAKKLAADITPAGRADDAAAGRPVVVHQEFDIETLMQVFKPDRSGGLEWEKKLLTLAQKKAAYSTADYKTLVPLMYRIAAVAQPTEAFAPAPMGKKTPDEWIKLSREMGMEALAVADLAKKPKPDDKMVKAAVKKVEATCTSCHDKYRDTK